MRPSPVACRVEHSTEVDFARQAEEPQPRSARRQALSGLLSWVQKYSLKKQFEDRMARISLRPAGAVRSRVFRSLPWRYGGLPFLPRSTCDLQNRTNRRRLEFSAGVTRRIRQASQSQHRSATIVEIAIQDREC